MTNRERVIAAINFQKPDFVPYHLRFTKPAHDKVVAYTGDPEYKFHINRHLKITSLHKPFIRIDETRIKDEFGAVRNNEGTADDGGVGVLDGVILKEPEDLDTYEFPPIDEAWIRSRAEKLSKSDPDNFRVLAIEVILFERAWSLRGMENFLCDMILEPDFAHALLDKITDWILGVLDIALEYEFDCVYFQDDWGQQKGLIMGPELWRTYIKPRFAKIADKIHAAGKYVAHHSCGDLRDIMGELHETGIDIYQTFQPEIYGLEYAKVLRESHVAIWGGISTQRDLPFKTAEEMEAITRELLAAFPEGGLIAAPTHDLYGDARPENIVAMTNVLMNQK